MDEPKFDVSIVDDEDDPSTWFSNMKKAPRYPGR